MNKRFVIKGDKTQPPTDVYLMTDDDGDIVLVASNGVKLSKLAFISQESGILNLYRHNTAEDLTSLGLTAFEKGSGFVVRVV